MNAFLVITGVLIVAILITLWVLKKFNIQTKIFGIPLKYILDIALLLIGIIVVIVIKVALGNKNKQLEALLLKLRITKAQNDINIVNDHIQETHTAISTIDQQIAGLQGTSNQPKIDVLLQQKKEIEQQLADLNQKKQGHADNKFSLEERVKQMQNTLNGKG